MRVHALAPPTVASLESVRVPDESMPTVGIIFEQFAAYHVDRCEAVAQRLAGQYRTLAVETATRSVTYAWEPSGGVAGADKLTLFPGRGFEEIGWPRRLLAAFDALRACRAVFVGLPYSRPDAIALTWWLRLTGVPTFVMTESKRDDAPRRAWFEWIKRQLLRSYAGALVGAGRQAAYMRELGFTDRPIVPGYDAVSIARVRRQAAAAAGGAWQERAFVYVGRFVAKKNLATLLRGYAGYAARAGTAARSLRLIGDGALRKDLEALARELGVADRVEWPGFLPAEGVSRALADALALCLVSTEEQWGLVVNEALALGLPVIVSSPVGSRDALVRDGVNGYVVEPDDAEGIAQAMFELSHEPARWERMSAQSHARAWLGDSERFADGVEQLLGQPSAEARDRLIRFGREMSAD